MASETGFHLYKWYADIVDEETDNITIIYLGELEWKFLKLSFTNILQFLQKHQLISRATFLNYRPPIFNNRSFHIDSMNNISGRWETQKESIREKLFENKNGYILWECFMPSALAQITIDGKIHQGFGYVERLTMTLKPWQMPIKILRWGRFLCENQSIVWIRWEGEEERLLIFHNGRKYLHGMINDELVEFGTYRLVFLDKYTLRDGPLIKTVFDQFIWIKKVFPSGLLHMNECKWQTRSELYENDCPIAQGWSIHENVDCKPKIDSLGKIFYGSLFTILLPLLLIFWAKQTERYIFLPIPSNSLVSIIFIVFGMMLMSMAMLDLWFKGHGLPMNAYPPPKLVTTGVYRILPHPIYVGGSFVCLGVSIYYQSKSGLWLVSPLLTLAWLALVYGYENEDLKRRFPKYTWKTLLHVPENIPIKCQWSDILSAYCFVLLPWLILYQTVIFIGPSSQSISTYLSFEYSIPVLEWTEVFYLLAYPYVALLPLVLHTKQQMRSFMIAGLVNISIGIYLQIILPLVAVPKEFIPTTMLGRILLHERDLDGPTGAFPSFHVSWAFLSAYYYSWTFPNYKLLLYIISILISASCVTTGMHSIIDVIAGFLLFIICIQREILWIQIRNYFENLANSWSAYRIGPLRIINQSFYGFLSPSIGAFMLLSLIGHTYAVLLVSLLSLMVAAIWAQFIENSVGLSRPFGYFGCIVGGILGSILASYLFAVSVLSILSAYALVSPWIQAIGRLRCVIQGCCHGRPTNQFLGISIRNPRSRVCSLSQLKNIPVHITAGYSIFANVIIGLFLWRLWYANISLGLILSLYFILIGLSRFVEEAFRGEIQTMICQKLTICQWMSILFVFIGIFISIIPFDDHIRLTFRWEYEYFIPSIFLGLIVAFAVGVDFPESKRRFSRLSD